MSLFLWSAMYFLLAVALLYVEISEVQTLKCRSKEHMRQEEDFYHLVNKCLKESTNSSNSTTSVLEHRPNEEQPQQPPVTQLYEPHRQQYHQQQKHQQQYEHQHHFNQQDRKQQQPPRYHQSPEYVSNRKPNDNYRYSYNADQHRDSPYRTNGAMKQPNFEFDDYGERYGNLPNTCTCISQDGRVYRYGFRERGYRTSSHLEKRAAVSPKIYSRTNSSTNNPTAMNKSPLENIDAPLASSAASSATKTSTAIRALLNPNNTGNSNSPSVPPVARLNGENKVDRQSMLLIMTLRIQEPELREFIEDSIDECYDFLDTGTRTDNHEELCNISKKLALCLEERAKRACDDWEVRDETPITTTASFNASKNFERHRENENRYSDGANPDDAGFNSHKNNFHKWNLNSGPRKYN